MKLRHKARHLIVKEKKMKKKKFVEMVVWKKIAAWVTVAVFLFVNVADAGAQAVGAVEAARRAQELTELFGNVAVLPVSYGRITNFSVFSENSDSESAEFAGDLTKTFSKNNLRGENDSDSERADLADDLTKTFSKNNLGGENDSDSERADLAGDLTKTFSKNSLRDENSGDAGRVIVNIQDLHNHTQVQKNIASILEILSKEYKVDRVFIEGGYGKIDLDWVDEAVGKNDKNKLTQGLMESGRLTGGEYFGLKNKKEEILFGLED
jgi:hypothetical protein